MARELVGAYSDGAWLVKLAGLTERRLAPHAVTDVLDVREQPNRPLTDTLVDALKTKEMLLVLDNCEHLIDRRVSVEWAMLRDGTTFESRSAA